MNEDRKRRLRLGPVLLAGLGLLLLLQGILREDSAPVFARMAQQTLIIDPGHGGEDGGAVSVSGQKESDINLAIARQLDQLMGFYGVRTVMTRETDVSIHDPSAKTLRQKKGSDLKNRVALINRVEGGTLISIHQNSCPNPKYRGAQVFFADETQSLPMARAIQEAIGTVTQEEKPRVPNHIPKSVYLMHHISCRAVLVECGFLSHPEEERLLQERAYQMKLAMAMTAGYLSCGNAEEGESLI